MPSRWLDAGLVDFHGIARFTRNFGYPGNIDETEHVWLTCDGCTGCREVRLNGQRLAEEIGPTFAFDVTKIMADRNRLEVLIAGESAAAGLWGEVALEIRKDAFLENLYVERAPSNVTVSGIVVGVAPQPLELYTLVDGRHLDYRTIPATSDGTPFKIELPDLPSNSQTVRVELINISSIWYVVELSIPHWKSV
jgi:hypothetical protein